MPSFYLDIFISLCCLFGGHYSYPNGAPVTACSSMTPGHQGTLPQNSPSPFSIVAGVQNTDGTVQVTLEGTDQSNVFRGFMLQAFYQNYTVIPGGTFSTSEGIQVLQCTPGQENALTHTSKELKSNVITFWMPPPDFNDVVVFKATIVQQYDTYWVGLESNAVSMLKAGTSNPTTDVPLVMTTDGAHSNLYSGCGSIKGCFGLPRNCLEKRACTVVLSYSSAAEENMVRFELVGALGADSGWIAMGLSRNSKMGDDSVTECVFTGNGVQVRESWNVVKPRKGNVLLAESSKNISDDEGEYENGVMTCRWNRPVVTVANGISFDLAKEQFYILLAKGPLDGSGNKVIHSSWLSSAHTVNLTFASLVIGKTSTLIKIHGSFMTAAWLGFVSLGILLARHYKEVWTKYKLCGNKVWFSVHRCFMLLSVALVIAGFAAIFVDVDGWSDVAPNPHPVLGIVATALIVIQPVIAVCRPPPLSPKRPVFRWIHGMVGNGAQMIACVNMFFAVSLKDSNVPRAFYWVLVTFIIFHCLVHLLIHLHSCVMERERVENIIPERESNTKLHQFQFGDGYEINEDAPGSAFKKFALGLYSMVTVGLTVALVLMICLN